ncbi:hypothetical protein JCM9140_2530 [Halalkalibacter wakoensis JCM 9140]|uniref:Uncharacterized protein n=2 Tax=Halalkalibacter wakoensis TaxID=127891 RepID=W4Q334_9BACI|nr:hypothetical protein JCM9140_2530 [Halalkalibacter wakoensis JCM 9140]
MYAGGAHGMPFKQGFSFDTKTGHMLTLEEVATAPGAKQRMNREIERQIDSVNRQYSYPVYSRFEGVDENYGNFYI